MSTSRWSRAVLTLAASAALALGGVEPAQAAPPLAERAARLPPGSRADGRRRRRRRRDAADRAEPRELGPCDADIAFGEVISCNVPNPTTIRDLTFAAATGDKVRVRRS